jgi:hypothetical protein
VARRGTGRGDVKETKMMGKETMYFLWKPKGEVLEA